MADIALTTVKAVVVHLGSSEPFGRPCKMVLSHLASCKPGFGQFGKPGEVVLGMRFWIVRPAWQGRQSSFGPSCRPGKTVLVHMGSSGQSGRPDKAVVARLAAHYAPSGKLGKAVLVVLASLARQHALFGNPGKAVLVPFGQFCTFWQA